MALASALEQKSDFTKIILTRPMVHLEDEDRMGFLPGGMDDKMKPWLAPFEVSLAELSANGKADAIKKVIELSKLVYLSLDYIRGTTFHRTFIIVDDAQNLTSHQIKSIITRAGRNTKMVFTGDLGQIDRKRLIDRRTSGLNYAISQLRGEPLVGITNFRDSVRSPLTSMAERLL